MLREGMFIADRYEILEKIGSGGMADVYKAKCHKLNRLVAIKVLKPEFCDDRNFVSKFRIEAQSAAGLMHSNIVNVYDVGEEDNIYYIIMELVEGITLKKYIERKGHLAVREAVSVAIQVAQGIEAAHKHHIVHRDIKPQNIIISKEGKVKVTDFGIARAASANTINSSVMGSVHYASPEQARGGYSDEKSDIYSFGITLYEMLTGRVPFEGDSTVTVALQHIQDEIVSPKTYVSDIPVSVEKIVLKCTQKKTDRRYQTMTDVIADLKRSLVTPDEDFVVISSVIPNGATQLINQDDMNEINKRASIKPAEIDVVETEHYDNTESSYEEDGEAYYEENTDVEYNESEDVSEEEIDEALIENKESKKLDKVITVLGISVGVVIIVIAIIVIVKMVRLFSNKNDNGSNSNKSTQAESLVSDGIAVPNLLGMTYDEAKEALSNVKLGITSTEDYTDLQDEGRIFKQSVNAGEKVDEHTTINVVISKGIATFDMPDWVGMNKSELDSAAKEHEIKLSRKYEETSDESLIDKVKETKPAAGEKIKNGATVEVVIYIKKTEETAVVPDVAGKTETEAVAELEAKGFKNIDRNYDYSDTVPEGSVIAQSGVSAGDEVVTSTVIVITISQGPKMIVVPNVVGKTEEEAKNELTKSGFTNIVTEHANSDTVAAGLVISQGTPAAGEKALASAAITITISDGIQEIVVENVIGKTSDEAISILTGAGFTNVTTKEGDYSDTVAAGVVTGFEGVSAGDRAGSTTPIILIVSKGAEPVSNPKVSASIDFAQVAASVADLNTATKIKMKISFVYFDKDVETKQSTIQAASLEENTFAYFSAQGMLTTNEIEIAELNKDKEVLAKVDITYTVNVDGVDTEKTAVYETAATVK